MSEETIGLGCVERFTFGKEGNEKLQSFHQEMPGYLDRAVSGENKYNLQLDRDWTQFIYENSKMSWKKILVLLIGMAPSLTKFPSFFTQRLLMSMCQISFYDIGGKLLEVQTLTIKDCKKYTENSQWFERKFFTTELNDVIEALGLLLLMALPQWIFLALVWTRFRNSKYIVWMNSAKIHLTSFSKRLLTAGYFAGCLFLACGSLAMSSVFYTLGLTWFTQTYDSHLSSTQKLSIFFDRTNISSSGQLISNMLIYSCLLTMLISHVREPIAFFTGFRMYLKKAASVPYNTAAVDFRMKKDAVNWKFVKMYYEQCQRYSPQIVLNAMTTHFLDLEILQVEKSSGSFLTVKSE